MLVSLGLRTLSVALYSEQYTTFRQDTVSKTEVRDGVVVNALRYKPAGRGFDSRLCHWNFSVT